MLSFDQTLAYPRRPAWTLQCVSLSAGLSCCRGDAGSFSVTGMEKGGVFLVPSFSFQKGTPILTVTAVRRFSGSLGFVPFPSCCAESYKSLVSIDLNPNHTMRVRVSSDGCRLEFVFSPSFSVD